MASQTTLLTRRAQRLGQSVRPATLRFANSDIPCVCGNLEFFERLSASGGFTALQTLHVIVLRGDFPAGLPEFKRGQNVRVTDNESGDVFEMVVGENNSRQASIIILNLERNAVN